MLVGSVFVFVPEFSRFVSLEGTRTPLFVNVADIPPFRAWAALAAVAAGLGIRTLRRPFLGLAIGVLGAFVAVAGLALLSRHGPLGRWSDGARPFLPCALVLTGVQAGFLARPELRRLFTPTYRARVKADPDRRPKVWRSGFFWPVAIVSGVVFFGAIFAAGR